MKDEEELMGRLSPTANGIYGRTGSQVYARVLNHITTEKYCSRTADTLLCTC